MITMQVAKTVNLREILVEVFNCIQIKELNLDEIYISTLKKY
jgi:hypothetical protein